MDAIERGAIFRGEIVRRDACDASRALCRIARQHAARAFECDITSLRSLHERDEDPWSRTCAARVALAEDPEARAASIELALALGFSRETLAFDAPRLRVVAPHAHARPAAARAYYMHRDTWYGSPAAQVNVWVPLFDVDERDSFAIWPAALGARVENDSATFDYERFTTRGGFQSAGLIDAAYPRALETPPGSAFRVRAKAAEVVAFAAAHLHATTPNETNATRLSVDVRFVDLGDHERGEGARDDDNASRGCAIGDYMRGNS
jgi:hypothetical protein